MAPTARLATDEHAAEPNPLSTAKANGPGPRTAQQTASDLAFCARAMRSPVLPDAAERLAERTRAEPRTHAEYLVAVPQREVGARESHGGEDRIRGRTVRAHGGAVTWRAADS
ncbi:hypothetical protein ABIA32_001892 [Streptacidiphilus sp. MAP12-20]|uniref:hypothetical protein n=1 Tax=Streptacidiphilus sp. MAP12-20 TaxID=3156299 RepID=UPI0035165BCC